MKFEDLKLVQKWREYAGPKDERLEAESAKIYKIGFVAAFVWHVDDLFLPVYSSTGCVGSQRRQ